MNSPEGEVAEGEVATTRDSKSTRPASRPGAESRAWLSAWMRYLPRGMMPTVPLMITLSGLIGALAGVGATAFSILIHFFSQMTVESIYLRALTQPAFYVVLCFVPAIGLLIVSWVTKNFAPEAQGHGVPEVIMAVARHDGIIRPRVAVVKILASAICIGTGGSVGREGPIVQIGSSLGSVAGQFFKLSAPNIKVLVASGAAAGISATFNAPLAGVIFASEIILGSFAVESMTPIVIASVLANVVQKHIGEHGLNAAFPAVFYRYFGAWNQLPSFLVLGLLAGLSAVVFVKLLYACEDLSQKWFKNLLVRGLVLGLIVGVLGVAYSPIPPHSKTPTLIPPLFGVGYDVVEHTVRLDRMEAPTSVQTGRPVDHGERILPLDREAMGQELLWLIPLFLLKPVMTSLTLGGGGSGGIFAPSLYIGATLGGAFGLACNLIVPSASASPGVYAIVGMGAVVAGTTQGVLSAIIIVYEMTNDYHIILPIMIASGVASVVAESIDPESIYLKKLSRRGVHLSRGHDMHRVEHVMVRDVMIREFPSVSHKDNLAKIVRVARANSHIETLPVMNDDGKLVGIIRPEDLHRVLDTDVASHLVNADDIALTNMMAVSPDANLLEALRDFGQRDVETLPVEEIVNGKRRLVGLLLRSDVMRRYRVEMLRRR